ncbi:hypothetical protein GOBAR_AA23520 [Gossypium barbadense]|uniref:Uncharacterized protein n=1 Tax=Gossypium barbadense TaxID=3634 RepID=A0A2P5X1F2_GOSBA|nr:hypothetical protein GOBAR_AA23520 [Gossypium barbadense]
MNPNVEPLSHPALAPPPLPPQPHRPSTSCDRHPHEQFTGFCPSCLCEPIFKPSGGSGARPGFFPEIRRTKSFSASKNEAFSGVFEPQRKSCDVRGRSTLWSLFYEDGDKDLHAAGNGPSSEIVEVEGRNLASSSSVVQGPVFESKEEDQTESETDRQDDIEIIEEEQVTNVPVATASFTLTHDKVEEIEQEYEKESCLEEELKPMKDHIDLDSQTKKASGRDFKIAGSFWSAASVFSKKLQKWRQKQKLKKTRNGGGSARLPVEKPIGRQYRETQSEVADYGFGRRSCDTDPRFSLDAARMSFDDPRYSFDEPRASWDGYLIGRTFPRMPTMLSVVEDDAPVQHVMRGRKSLDRSSSIRKTAAAVVAEMDEMKSVSNLDYSNGHRDSNSNSLRGDYSDTFEIGLRDNAASVYGNGERKGSSTNKWRRWSKAWNIWGFIHRRSVNNKNEDEDRYCRSNGVERSYSESWPESRAGFDPKVLRSVSWRNNSSNFGGATARMNYVESNGQSKKKREEFVLERNRSARYSPNDFDNGLLRFYLAPMQGSRRSGSGKNRGSHAHSISSSVLRLY